MNTLFQILVGLVISALVAVLAVPYFMDWNQYKSEIEAKASELLGRRLTVGGDVRLRLLPSPYLYLEKISVKPVEQTGDAPALLEAEAFKLWLAGPPLLRGVIEVEVIDLFRPKMLYAIDKQGRSNWTRLAEASAGRLPFRPKAISLQSLKIVDGSLHATSADLPGRTLALDNLNGDFSAGSLVGPFKFEGVIGAPGENQQSVRLSTGRIDDKGELQFKSVMRVPEKGYRYSFDGALTGLNGQAGLTGVIGARFPFLVRKDSKRIEPLEAKAAVNVDARSAAFDKVLVTLVHKNRPQMMTGGGRLSWREGKIDFTGSLGSRLVDLDHLKDGLKFGNSVSETIGWLFGRLKNQSRYVDSGSLRLQLQQIKLNSDLIQNIDFEMKRDADGLKLQRLEANLPGDNRLRLEGHFRDGGSGNRAQFVGQGRMLGLNLGRLVAWSSGRLESDDTEAISARPFTLRGDVILSDMVWGLKNVYGDIADTAFTGDIAHLKPLDGKPGEISLNLIASEIDTAALTGQPLSARQLVQTLSPDTGAHSSKTTQGSSLLKLLGDNILRLELRSGRLKLADFVGQDLVADLYYGTNRLDIAELSLRSADGLHLHADGRIERLQDDPNGSVTGSLNVERPEELRRLLSWFMPETELPGQRQLAALAPLRLAVMLETEAGKAGNALLRLNGIAGSSQVAFNNRISGSKLFSRGEGFSIGQMEMTGTLSNRDGRMLLTQLLPHLRTPTARLPEIGNGKLWLTAAGLPSEGLSSRLQFTANRASAGFEGRVGWRQGKSRLAGQMQIKSDNLGAGLALLGLSGIAAGDSGDSGIDLKASVDVENGTLLVSGLDGSLAGAELQGNGKYAFSDDKRALNMVLITSHLDLPRVFGLLLDGGAGTNDLQENPDTIAGVSDAARKIEETVNTPTSAAPLDAVLPGTPFNKERLRNIDADLLITADAIRLGSRLALQKGELSVRLHDDKVELTRLGGRLWDGDMQMSGELDLSATIAEASGQLIISKADLEQAPFILDELPLLSGRLDLTSKFGGKGVSPSGILSLLNGSGAMQISGGRVNRFNGAILDDIVEDELGIWDQAEDTTPFQQRFRRHLVNADLELQSFTQDFAISDGILEFKSAGVNGDTAKIDLDFNLTLANLATQSRLTVSPLEKAKHAGLPPAGFSFSGTLDRLDKIETKLETASLEQHLKVMKMEHDVELLEKLHKQDEEIARKAAERREAERKRREEEEARLRALQQTGAETEAVAPGEEIPGNGAAPSDQPEPQPRPANRPRWNPFGDRIGGSVN